MLLAADGTTALMASGSFFFIGGDFGSATADSVTVSMNDSTVDYAATPLTISIDGVSATLNVGLNVQSVSVVGLAVDIAGFISLGGNFGFRITGANIEVAANEVFAQLEAGDFKVGVNNGSLAMLLAADGTTALMASGSFFFIGGDFGSATADSVTVSMNDSTVDYAATPLTISIDGVSATLNVGLNVQSVSVVGLAVDIAGFISLGGNFGFRITGANIEVAANEVFAQLEAGDFKVGVNNGSLAMLLAADGTTALMASGSFFFIGGDFGSATADSVTVSMNDSTVDYAATPLTISIDGVSATLNVGLNVQSVSVVGLAVDIAGFISLGGNFGFRITGADIEVAASEVYARLEAGAFRVGVENGSLAMLLNANGTMALTASGSFFFEGGDFATASADKVTVELNDSLVDYKLVPLTIVIDGVSAELSSALNTKAVTVEGFETEIAGFVYLTGNFAFVLEETAGQRKISAAASEVGAFLGVDRGTSSALGLELSNGTLGLVLFADGTYALDGGVDAALVGISALTVEGSMNLRINNTGMAVNETISIGADTVSVVFADGVNIMQVTGSINLNIAGFLVISGDFGFEKSTVGTTTKIIAGAANVNAFLGTPDGTLGVQVSNAFLGLVLYSSATGPSTYALVAGGEGALIGIDAITLSGSLAVRVNNTGALVNESVAVGTSGETVDIVFDNAANIQAIEGSILLDIAGFVVISGEFSFEKTVVGVDTKILVGAANIDIFVGLPDQSLGVRITDGFLGMVLYSSTTGPSTYALTAGGTAELVGIPALTLIGSLNVRLNNTGLAVNETILFSGSGTTVDIVFATGANIQAVSGSIILDIAGFVSLSGDFGFEKQVVGTDTKILVAAANVNSFLGTSDQSLGVRITGAELGVVLLKVGGVSSYALTASGTAELIGIPALTLSGSLAVRVNNTGATVNESISVGTAGDTVDIVFTSAANIQSLAGSVILDIAGFVSIDGEFGFEKSVIGTQTKILIGANVNAFLGLPDQSLGVRITDANLALVMFKDGAGPSTYALSAGGTAALVGISGLTLSGSLAVRVNTTGQIVDETINVGTSGSTVNVAFASSANVQALTGSIELNIADFVVITGDFGFEKSVVGTETTILAGAKNVNVFLGTPDQTLGVRITDAFLGLVMFKNAAGVSTYALSAGGNAELLGVDGLILSGSLFVRVNNTGIAVNEQILVGTEGDMVDVIFTTGANVQQLSGSVFLSITDFITITGDFGFERTVTATGTKLLVGAANVTTFLGTTDESLGVQITNGFLGLVLFSPPTGSMAASTYALVAGGTAELIGIEGLTLIGSPSIGINNTGKLVNETVTVGNGAVVQILFTTVADVQRLSGELTLSIENFVSISGNFIFEKQTTPTSTRVLIAATGVSSFLGVYNDDGTEQIGLKIKNANIAVLLFKDVGATESKFALVSSGTASLVGLDGLQIEGSLGVQINRSGKVINETINTPTGPIELDFNTTQDIQIFSGSISLAISGVFSISGSLQATMLESGLLIVDILDMSLSILADGEEVFGISAAARFAITPIDGFTLLDIRMRGFSIFGIDAVAAPSSPGMQLPVLAQPPPFGTTTPVNTNTPPTATLTYPTAGDSVDATILNAKAYIDITFQDKSGLGLDDATITDAGTEITISGAGVGDAILTSVESLGNNTYRYRFTDSNLLNKVGLFKEGSLNVNIVANSFADLSGKFNVATSYQVLLVSGMAAGTVSIAIGPLQIVNPTVGIVGFGFKAFNDAGELAPRIILTVGIGADVAGLSLGGPPPAGSTSGSGTTGSGSTGSGSTGSGSTGSGSTGSGSSGSGSTGSGSTGSSTSSNEPAEFTLAGLLGTFDVALDLDINDLFAIPDVSLTGKFGISIETLTVRIPEVLEAVGTGLFFGYDPAGGDDQELVRITSLSVTIIPISLTGALTPFTRTDGTTIPGLSIRGNGFTLGSASLQFNGEIAFSTVLSIKGIKVGISDLDITYGESVEFNGEIFIAADEATIFKDSPISVSMRDGPDVGTEAVRATLTFDDGVVDGFRFAGDQLEFKFSTFLTIKGQGVMIDSRAAADEEVVSFISLGATLNAGPLQVGGSMRNFAFLGDGSFRTKTGFGVFLSVEAASGGSVGWPSWMPIKITEIGLIWDDINNHPEDFLLIFSASIDGLFDLPLQISGAVERVVIDIGLLLEGKFPILDVGAFAVTVEGDLFGMQVKGGLLFGILKLTGNDTDGYRMITISDPLDTPVDDRVMFVGLEAGAEIAGMGGLTIRVAFSELGAAWSAH